MGGDGECLWNIKRTVTDYLSHLRYAIMACIVFAFLKPSSENDIQFTHVVNPHVFKQCISPTFLKYRIIYTIYKTLKPKNYNRLSYTYKQLK